MLLKIDFKNAFNSIRRDKILEAVHDLAPNIYPFTHLAYEEPSHLFFNHSHVIPSQEGVQQGDPLGPLLFCLIIHSLVNQLPLQRFYKPYNKSKSEIICKSESYRNEISLHLPCLKVLDLSDAHLLGSPIGNSSSINSSVSSKVATLNLLGTR